MQISKTQDGIETTWFIVGLEGAHQERYLISDTPGGPPQRVCYKPDTDDACRVHTCSQWLRYEAIP